MRRQISPDDSISDVRKIMEELPSTEEFFERMFYRCLGCPLWHSDRVAQCAVECDYSVGKAVRLLNQCLQLIELSGKNIRNSPLTLGRENHAGK